MKQENFSQYLQWVSSNGCIIDSIDFESIIGLKRGICQKTMGLLIMNYQGIDTGDWGWHPKMLKRDRVRAVEKNKILLLFTVFPLLPPSPTFPPLFPSTVTWMPSTGLLMSVVPKDWLLGPKSERVRTLPHDPSEEFLLLVYIPLVLFCIKLFVEISL